VWEGLEVRGQGVDGIFDGWRKGRKKMHLVIVKNVRFDNVCEKQNRSSEKREIVKNLHKAERTNCQRDDNLVLK
jgi:hypothetical protein